jgi:hypothetical protein
MPFFVHDTLDEVQFSHKMKVSFHMNKTALKLTPVRWQVNKQICNIVPCNWCFFLGNIFAKFQPEKYDFDLYKGFLIEKMAQILQTLRKKKFPNCHIFMISSKR